MSDVWDGLLSLHGAEAEAGALSDDAVLVREQLDELVHDVLVRGAGASQGDGSHSSDVGVIVSEERFESLDHSRASKFGWEYVCVCGRERGSGSIYLYKGL